MHYLSNHQLLSPLKKKKKKDPGGIKVLITEVIND